MPMGPLEFPRHLTASPRWGCGSKVVHLIFYSQWSPVTNVEVLDQATVLDSFLHPVSCSRLVGVAVQSGAQGDPHI